MATAGEVTFSLSIPVSGQPEFLGTALRSVDAQTVPVELAVLDASPGDAVQEVIQRHRPRIAYGRHGPDAGQAAAIQEGWAHTNGEVVAWLNADDYYYPGALGKVAAVFRAHPEVDVVYGHGVHVSPGGDFQMYFPGTDRNVARITRRAVICQPSCFVRRRAVERVGGLDTALHYTMDWDLWVRLYRAGCTFRFLDAPLAAVRVYPETKTLSGAGGRYREIRRLLRAGGVSWPERAATLLAFRYYDLRNRPRSRSEQLACSLLAGLASVDRRLTPRGPSHIRGLECWTNRVEAGCVVELPWYYSEPPREVVLVTDRPVALSLTANDRPEQLTQCGVESVAFLGERVGGQRYRAGLQPDGGKHLFSFRIDSRSGPWRLLFLGLRDGREG